MTQLWPRIDPATARLLHASQRRRSVLELASAAATHHDRVTYAATGAARVQPDDVGRLVDALRTTAAEFGYPRPVDERTRVRFDRAAAEDIYAHMQMTTVEAAHPGVWNFLAVVAAPDLCAWRWAESTNIERWICTDRTRHMYGRLWWQALTFARPSNDHRVDLSLLRELSESDLNQITERRSIAGNPRLAQALAQLLIAAPAETRRRELLRGLTPRLRRRLAFIDFTALSDDQLLDHLRALTASG